MTDKLEIAVSNLVRGLVEGALTNPQLLARWDADRGSAWFGKPSDDWQPIETAPRDGTAVLIAVPDEEQALIANWYSYNGLATWRDIELDVYPTATHWQPLPLPPLTA